MAKSLRKTAILGVDFSQEDFTLAEVAFILNIQVRTARSYTRRPSKIYPNRMMLEATKNGTMWSVKREDLKKLLEELYGAGSAAA